MLLLYQPADIDSDHTASPAAYAAGADYDAANSTAWAHFSVG